MLLTKVILLQKCHLPQNVTAAQCQNQVKFQVVTMYSAVVGHQ